MRPTALIAEDEAPQRVELVGLLAELWPELEVVAACADGIAASNALATKRPAVAFLDIRMPGASGLDVARAAGETTHVVFVSAYDEFAVQAFEDGAADYLLKPVMRDRLASTIQRLKRRIAAGERADLTDVLAALAGQDRIKWIAASVRDEVRMIAVDAVLFFESEDKHTRVVTAEGEAHIRTPLKALIARLDPDLFWQVHRGVVVRVSAIRAVRRDEDGKLRIVVPGQSETLPVSTAYAYRFKGM
jgi:DNA-binding LytR/AlgR family response regulator